MSDNDLNIARYIKALEGNHDLYPNGINKKINIKKLYPQNPMWREVGQSVDGCGEFLYFCQVYS